MVFSLCHHIWQIPFQLNRQLGGSMPNCAANSACSSRRSSRASAVSGSAAYGGQYGSNPSSRRSSGSRPGSRRESFLTPQDSSDSTTGPTHYLSAAALASSAAQVPGGLAENNGDSSMSAGQSLLQSIGALVPYIDFDLSLSLTIEWLSNKNTHLSSFSLSECPGALGDIPLQFDDSQRISEQHRFKDGSIRYRYYIFWFL